MRSFAAILFAAATTVVATACAPSAGGRTPAPSREACGDVAATGDAQADVSRLAAACAGGMTRVRGEASGVQGVDDPSLRLTLVSRGKRHCFRVLAAGDVGVTELDVQVLGPNGAPLVRDTQHGALAVVPETSLLCLPDAGSYTVEIAVTAGRGAFAAQVFASE